jgi:hypothetical protein
MQTLSPVSIGDRKRILDIFYVSFVKLYNVNNMQTANKVFNADIVCALPQGKSCFLWFTMLAFPDPTCILIDLDSFNLPIIESVAVLSCSFKLPISYGSGTVIKGTRFESGRMYFSIEEPLYYKGESIGQYTWAKKMTVTKTILEQELDQNIAKKHSVRFIIIGLPLMSKTITDLMKLIHTAGYKVNQLQYINTQASHSSKITFKNKTNYNKLQKQTLVPKQSIYAPPPPPVPPQSTQSIYEPRPQPPPPVPPQSTQSIYEPHPQPPPVPRTCIFTVCPTETTDIYNLFNIGERDLTNIDRAQVAGIYAYKTSVLMNSIFRNIKENSNLDALEESDDESEFEDEDELRTNFVIDMKMKINMVCEYSSHFKKWVPIRRA